MTTQKLNEVIALLASLEGDVTIPKNIRKALSEARRRLEGPEEQNVKVSAAVYQIDSVSEDINMPAHARTQIWAIVGALESIKVK